MKAPPDRAVLRFSRPVPQVGQSRGSPRPRAAGRDAAPAPRRSSRALPRSAGPPSRERRGEVAPEPREHVLPVPLAGRDVVELLLEVGGEVVAHVLAEIVRQERGHEPPLVLGDQPALVLADILPLLDRGDDRGIGRRPPDPEFLHPLDERGLGVARRRLGEVLLGRDARFSAGSPSMICGSRPSSSPSGSSRPSS
jgi:hypothetical protein